MQRDTMFRIASMTKPVTVAAAMTLVDEGRLALTDPVAKWLPELSGLRRGVGHSRFAGRHRSRRAADHHRRPDDPPQRFRVRVLGGRPAGPGIRQAVAPSGPGPLAGGPGQASAGTSARRATDVRRLDRRARYRAVAYRGQAAGPGAVRAHLRPARHARHRLQRRPDRPAARGDDVPTRRRRQAAPRLHGSRTHCGSSAMQRRGGAVVDGRRLSALRADAARGRNARRSACAVRRVGPADAD